MGKVDVVYEVCKLLDLDVNERFRLAEFPGDEFSIDEKGLVNQFPHRNSERADSVDLSDIISGRVTIEYLEFLPKLGQKYWSLVLHDSKLEVLESVWQDYESDRNRLKNGLCYRSYDQALDKCEEIARILRFKDWEGK